MTGAGGIEIRGILADRMSRGAISSLKHDIFICTLPEYYPQTFTKQRIYNNFGFVPSASVVLPVPVTVDNRAYSTRLSVFVNIRVAALDITDELFREYAKIWAAVKLALIPQLFFLCSHTAH